MSGTYHDSERVCGYGRCPACGPNIIGGCVASQNAHVVVVGAGPAGLTAAYALTKVGEPVTVLEADDVVGGTSRTGDRDGGRFDMGGHRFFTMVEPVEELWHEILPEDDFLLRPRMS